MAVGTNEKILLNYLHSIEYNNDALNAIGSTASTTLRTIETPTTAATKYVKKFGNAYTITDITAGSVTVPRSDGGGANKWWYEFYDFDTHTLMATVKDENGASAFVDGAALAAPASGIYVKVIWKSGTVTINAADRINVDTDIDVGGRNIRLSAESFTSGEMLFYFAYSSSSYYMDDINDQSAMYGGHRVAGGGSLRQPYYNIQDAIDGVQAAGPPFDNVTVLDSETYDEEIETDVAGMFLQAALGQTPTITRGAGARVTREVSTQYNNGDAIYFNENGLDADAGTWQAPKLTIAGAIAARVAHDIIYGGTGATGVSTFPVAVVIAAAYELEADYGYTPSISSSGIGVNVTHLGGGVRGFNIFATTGSTVGVDVNIANWVGKVIGNTIYNFGGDGVYSATVSDPGATIDENIIYNCANGIYFTGAGTDSAYNIRKNIIYSNSANGIYANLAAGTDVSVIQNNLIYLNGFAGLRFTNTGPPGSKTTTIQFNTCTQNLHGIYLTNNAAALNIVVENNICWDNTTTDLIESSGVGTETFTGGVYLTNTNWTIANSTTDDPKFCKITAPYEFGISADSSAYRLWNDLDAGLNLQIIEINESDITINGLIINGQNFYTSGIYIADVADHTGLIIRWNNIFDCIGIQLDPYDDDVDTNCIITNNIIRDGGNGMRLARGGNTVQENLIYGNTIFGIWSDYTAQEFTHNVFHGNHTGLYLESNSAGVTIKDNIFSGNSNYDINSQLAVIPTYCCIEGAVSSNVDITSDTNKLTDPLFVDVSDNNYNLKVIEGNYLIDSPCREAASDGKDMGAWDMDRSIESESWRKYQLAWNPRKLDPEYNGKGVTKFENALGFTKMFEKAHLRVLPFQWSRTQASTEELWKKIQYLSSLVPDRDQGRTEDQCRIRVNPLPSQLIISGTAATISAATKTILDTNLNLTEDQLKGYWASVIFESGTGMTIDAALKTGTVGGTPWVVNEHVGRYQHINGNYYVVKSNTVNVVTLSDARDTLVNGIIAWAFEKYFKMIKTENQILHLEDEDGELPTGSYDYYVDFIEMHVVKPGFKTIQERFYWLQETWKTGFNLFLEEL